MRIYLIEMPVHLTDQLYKGHGFDVLAAQNRDSRRVTRFSVTFWGPSSGSGHLAGGPCDSGHLVGVPAVSLGGRGGSGQLTGSSS